jgi:predicted metal-dependent hydrolase
MGIEITKFIRSKRRTIALIVERDGSLTVRAPKRATIKDVQSFIQQKTEWIIRAREKLKSVVEIPKKQFVDGEKYLYLGDAYELKLVKPQRPALKFDHGFYLGHSSQKRGAQVFTRWYKEQALKIISERVRVLGDSYGFALKRVKITSARTRWGSCSADGTLNFTWRLVMAPLSVVDYVVVHELSHLRVKNHSRRFWKVVEDILPGYQAQRKWLRQNGEKLGL